MRFKLRRFYLYYLGRILAFIVYILPLGVGLYIGKKLGRLSFHLLIRYRHIAIANLKDVFGTEKPMREIESIAARLFENLAKNGVEFVNLPKLNRRNIDRFVRVENIDIVNKALEGGKGVIIITGHFGNWELLAVTMRLKDYRGAVIGRRIYFDRYDRYLNSLRQFHGVNIIYRDESPKKILRVLKDNGIMGILADQDVDSIEGIFVNFLGRPAYTAIGPVALARASGAALIPAFMIRNNGRHTLKIEKPIELVDTDDKEKDIIENTQRWSSVIESCIRKYPDHWVWVHRRWKTKETQNSKGKAQN